MDESASIDLSGLKTILSPGGGHVRFDSSQSSWTLSSLLNAAGGDFYLKESCSLDLPLLQTLSNGSIYLPTNATCNADVLNSFGGSLTVQAGAVFNAPLLDTLIPIPSI